jgi:hypothetical protein
LFGEGSRAKDDNFGYYESVAYNNTKLRINYFVLDNVFHPAISAGCFFSGEMKWFILAS